MWSVSYLQSHGVSQVLEGVDAHLLVQLGELEHHGSAQAGSAVRGAGGDVAQVVVIRVGISVEQREYGDMDQLTIKTFILSTISPEDS